MHKHVFTHSNAPDIYRVRHLIITGGTGYIGSALVKFAIPLGFKITLLGRFNDQTPSVLRRIKWSVGEELPKEVFSESLRPEDSALIHLAHNWEVASNPTDLGVQNVNIEGTKILLESAKEYGVARFVFASSLSARVDALNSYGRIKWEIEKYVTEAGGISARIGLVYGGQKSGMYGSMIKLTKLPFLPMLTPRRPVQPIHLYEVCEGLLRLSQSREIGYKSLADPHSIQFGQFLKSVARIEHGRKLFIIPISLKIALIGAFFTKFIPGLPTIDRERVLGLAGAQSAPANNDVCDLGLILGKYAHLSTGYLGVRGLLIEGRTLLRYVLGVMPSSQLLRRYVIAVRKLNPSSLCLPIGLPISIICFPTLTRFIEPMAKDSIISSRLEIASLISEFSVDGEKIFFGVKGRSRVGNLLSLMLQIFVDICALPFRVCINLRARNGRH
ncbi:NAD(P)-dependent oxidoreductase [Polynucleobacter paneuropaeus]|nr:NAD(P)-dependent oxidoreductase [Polynucleobacter paneuropaeus]